jgi:hypothetical protein
MVRLKAQFHGSQGHETAHKQSRSEQKGEGEGNLENNYGVANTGAAGGTDETLAGVSHGVGQIAARGLQSREESKKKNGADADDHSDRKRT